MCFQIITSSISLCRREAVQVSVRDVRVGVCALRRAHTSRPETHWRQTVPLRRVRSQLRALRPPLAPHATPRDEAGGRVNSSQQ